MARSPGSHTLADLGNLFGMLADPTRLHIVLLVAKGPRNVTSLCDELNMRQPNVSHHLGLLRMTGLLVTQRQGKQVLYSLAPHAKAAGGKVRVSLPPYQVTLE